MAIFSLTKRAADWWEFRKKWEGTPFRQGIDGLKRKKWDFFYQAVFLSFRILEKTPLLKPLKKNAMRPQMKRVELFFAKLPKAFDGYQILHLTDLHLDCQQGLEQRILEAVGGMECDLILFTGDYQDKFDLDPYANQEALAVLAEGLKCQDGIYATLGNHDSYKTAELLESLGIKTLVNQTVTLSKGGQKIHLTGIDDVHYFYSFQTQEAIFAPNPGFKILAAHSPEAYQMAKVADYDLYLAGHTHGGQVCLPFGIPIVTHARITRDMVRGVWRLGRLVGYTNCGAGTSGIPIRWNCPGEILLLTLRCGEESSG